MQTKLDALLMVEAYQSHISTISVIPGRLFSKARLICRAPYIFIVLEAVSTVIILAGIGGSSDWSDLVLQLPVRPSTTPPTRSSKGSFTLGKASFQDRETPFLYI